MTTEHMDDTVLEDEIVEETDEEVIEEEIIVEEPMSFVIEYINNANELFNITPSKMRTIMDFHWKDEYDMATTDEIQQLIENYMNTPVKEL